jgi:hypothetical protein
MQARGAFGKWVVRGGLAALAISIFSLVAVPGAQAAAPAGSLKPFLNCYWDNGDDTVTVSLGVTSANAGTVSVPVGTDNQVTQGNPNRGQPTSFDSGLHNNVWAFTVTYAEITAGINWQVTGNPVAVNAVTPCTQKPMPADGNAMAVVAFGVLATVVGGYFLNDRTRGRRRLAAGA